jgi:hypothetical protein
MSILVRRINRAKWEQINNEDDISDSSADAITNCLKTTNNDLSVWKIDTIEGLEDAILALITRPDQTKLSTLHYVLLDENIVLEKGLTLTEEKGNTVVESLKDTHKNISKLTYSRLGIVKDLILDSLKDHEETFFTKAKLTKILNEAIKNGKVDKNTLNTELVKKEKL